MESARRVSRRFTTLDAMILIAATAPAAGLAWITKQEESWGHFFIQFEEPSSWSLYYNVLPTVALFTAPLLSAWTLAWVVLRLRGPRPRRRRLVRQPGVAVALVAALAWSVGGLATLRWGMALHHMDPSWLDLLIVQFASTTMLGGFGVAVEWAGSALAGRWKPERGWVNRMGRVLGVGWVAMGIPSGVLLEMFTGPFY